ncbi:MAG: hypothetical protein GWO24_28265, partial [Akkermansiaceae bacterium]|nr:hypothetical protein [Akkermansiaceae bacterium]
MVLMFLIGVGVLSLSTVTVRSESLVKAEAEARANARLALILALGELQKQLGPDQRITASAGILDDSPQTPQPDGVSHPHWTGVWNAWAAGPEAFGDDEPSKHRTIGSTRIPGLAPSYRENREDHFRSWLVSLRDEKALELGSAKDLALTGGLLPAGDGGAVRLVGKGALGKEADEADYVTAGLINVNSGARPGTERTGRIAWWVGDESTKARILPDAFDLGDDLVKDELISRAMSAGSTGHHAMEALKALDDPEVLQKMFTRNSLELAAAAGRGTRESFHHATPFSYGVLADVREGGLKRDLNALLERPIVLGES